MSSRGFPRHYTAVSEGLNTVSGCFRWLQTEGLTGISEDSREFENLFRSFQEGLKECSICFEEILEDIGVVSGCFRMLSRKFQRGFNVFEDVSGDFRGVFRAFRGL